MANKINVNFLDADWWKTATVEDVKAEIAKDADVNARDVEGTTPLMFAACHSNLEVTKLLIEHNADINAQDDHNQTALMHAAVRNNDPEIITFLVL